MVTNPAQHARLRGTRMIGNENPRLFCRRGRLGIFLSPLVLLNAFLTSPAPVRAQATNSIYTILQDTLASAGGQVGSGTPMSAQVTVGLSAADAASNGTFTVLGGLVASGPVVPPPVTMMTTVSGTIDDATAHITVNGTPATISGTTFTASGIPLVLGPNMITATATDAAGNTTSKTITVYLDLPAAQKTNRFTTQVHGTINDATAMVSVNGAAATITSGTFSAAVPLVSGLNTLTATATDPAGNVATTSIRVFVPLPTRPPAKPTVGTIGDPIPIVTTQSSVTIGGTKTAGTTLWINGTRTAATSDATTWTATLSLIEGDNTFSIVTKDATGVSSAEASVNIVVDNLPPVITVNTSTKTNFNPFTLKGSVDDSLTRVDVQGLHATRTGKTFEVPLPLVKGPNNIVITATSPNNYVSTKTIVVTLGTIPSIQTWSPLDGTKIYVGATTSIRITAVDAENDPIQYQVLLDGTPLADWSATIPSWTPTLAQTGLHILTVSARDDYGGSDKKDLGVFVIRSPVQHP